MAKKTTPVTQFRYLTIPQYATKKGVQRGMIYELVESGTIVTTDNIVEGKRLVDWEKYSDLEIGNTGVTRKRNVITREANAIVGLVLEKLKEKGI